MRRMLGLLFACTVVASCAGSADSQMPPAERIMGNELLGWDQLADTAEVASALRFALYVDGARFDMQNTFCGTTVGPAGFSCSSLMRCSRLLLLAMQKVPVLWASARR